MHRRKFLLAAATIGASAVLVPALWISRWKYIVVHHSAGNYGTIPFLQKVHRERQPHDPVDAIPYHYVIGNGNGLGLGEIASDWRQGLSLWGAHVSGNNSAHNFRGLGICLIGNLETNQLPPAQFDALVTLTRTLMARYGIEPGHVVGHGNVRGESTKCPGKYFPREKFERAIAAGDLLSG